MKISSIAKIISTKIDGALLNSQSYISTENMLPNCGGIVSASSVPSTKVTFFNVGDTLLSNIRPYFKKVWHARFNGGCSNDVICIRADGVKCLPKYLYYALSTDKFIDTFSASSKGTKMPRGDKNALLDYEIPNKTIDEQLYIVDILGTLDEKIEKLDNITLKIQEYGNKLFSLIPLNKLEKLTDVVTFTKGKEIGSFNYLDKQIDGSVPYIRVGDLIGRNVATFTTIKDVPLCTEEDILIAFDGAPGRNNYGLKGAISSGIQKVDCEQTIRGFVYFYLNSELCQNTIKEYTTATTIAHAGKAIKELQIPVVDDIEVYDKFNNLFTSLVALSKEKDVLQELKQLYLKKFFG